MTVAQSAGAPARPSRLQRAWSGFSIVFGSKVAVAGMIIVLFWLLLGLLSLFWTPYPPNHRSLTRT
jgi:peptide/nickel transport system permease protein